MTEQEKTEYLLRDISLPELPEDTARHLETELARELLLPELPPEVAQRLEADFARELALPRRRSYALPLTAAAAVVAATLGVLVLLLPQEDAPLAAAPAAPVIREKLENIRYIGSSDEGRRYRATCERTLSLPTGAHTGISITTPEDIELIIPEEPI